MSAEDTSAGHPYDLVPRGDGKVRYIEVKGTTGLGDQIHLTANEVEHARRHDGEVAQSILHSIDIDLENPAAPAASGRKVRILDPFDIGEGRLREVAYTWTLPRH